MHSECEKAILFGKFGLEPLPERATAKETVVRRRGRCHRQTGKSTERLCLIGYAERAAMDEALLALGSTTFDIHLNGEAFWHNVPAAVWSYRLGGYQALKK